MAGDAPPGRDHRARGPRPAAPDDNCPTDFCEDRDPCTEDSWTTDGGVVTGCERTWTTVACDDGAPCTLDDHCHEGACLAGDGASECGGVNPCDDQHDCRADTCVPGLGCFHPDVGDGAACAKTCSKGAPTCQAGVCTCVL